MENLSETIKTTTYIATSIDGFIARKDGGLDWLPTEPSPSGEDYGYQALMDSVDALVMGRNTYELVRSFGGDWPYTEKPVIVLSSQSLAIPKQLVGTVSSLNGEPPAIIEQLANRGYKSLYIDGGVTIQRFIRAGALQQLIITKIPILIGSGFPLFGALPNDLHLQHQETLIFDNGFVQDRYTINYPTKRK